MNILIIDKRKLQDWIKTYHALRGQLTVYKQFLTIHR